MSENKYNVYVSQQPTDGDPSTRAYKRRQLKNSWEKFIAKPGHWNIVRQIRRSIWKKSWSKFNIVQN